MAAKPKAPAVGAMFLYGEMLITIASAVETVSGRYVAPFVEVTSADPPIGGDVPEAEWSTLVPVREPLATAIRAAVAGRAQAWVPEGVS